MDYVDDVLLASLMSMGFERDVASQALVLSGNSSLDAAVDMILSGSVTATNTHDADEALARALAEGGDDKFVEDYSFLAPQKKKEPAKPKPKKEEIVFDPTQFDLYLLETKDEKPSIPKKSSEQPVKKRLKLSDSYHDSEEEEDDGDLDFTDGPALGISEREKTNTKCLEGRTIARSIVEEIDKVMNLTSLPFTSAAVLLKYFKWDVEKLTERYFEDPERIAKAAGLCEEDQSDAFQEGDCLICCAEMTKETASTAMCGHTFCNECWKGYFDVKIKEGGSLDIVCMAHKCGKVVGPAIIKRNVDEDTYVKYTTFFLNAFVVEHPHIKFCPAPGCKNAVYSEYANELVVPCNCGYRFCFICNEESHAPSDCEQMKKWKKKCEDDSETYNWLSANTKTCPKCHTAIEKNGGCNHMTCRKQGCGYEFCWICSGDWKNHTACNRFKEDTTADEARHLLERYLHYFHRYKTHMDSQAAENRLREAAVQKMIELQVNNRNSERVSSVDWIFEATEQLIECRRTLKYTYVFAYYLPDKSKEKNLFEYLQEDLESTTEKLSGVLEQPLTGSSSERSKMKDLTALAKRRLEHLLDGVKDGLTSGARFSPGGKEILDDQSSSQGWFQSIASTFTSGDSKKKPSKPRGKPPTGRKATRRGK